MIKNKFFLLIFLLFVSFGCSSSEESSPTGEAYFKATVTPALTGLDNLGIGNEQSSVIVQRGSDFETSKFIVNRNENLSYEVTFLDSENTCYTITVETFFNNKSFDSRTFEMNQPLNIGYRRCKDGYTQRVNLITPK